VLHIALQLWGGTFYLLNKIFFSRAERNEGRGKRMWKIRAWTVYLIGLPAWVIILLDQDNLIAAAAEIGGGPAMVLGLILALRGQEKKPTWLKLFDVFSIGIAATAGTIYSVNLLGGITSFNQILEFGIVAGFLTGTILLAKEQPKGYLWFLLMNGSNAVLQYREGVYFLAIQQVISLAFVIDAYLVNKRKAQLAPTSTPSPVF
jgi:hypothetical protein